MMPYSAAASCRGEGEPGLAVRSGFTLIELLVVVSIVALLVALLLPSLGRAKSAARQARCGANLRQTAVAWSLYHGDNKSLMVPGRLEQSGGPSWWWASSGPYGLTPYINFAFDVWRCPASPLEDCWSTIPTRYAVNSIASTTGSDNFAPPVLYYPITILGVDYYYHASKVSELVRPARTIAFIDTVELGYAPTRASATTSHTGYVGYWHQEKANLVLADGHVDWVVLADAPTYFNYLKGGYTFRTKNLP